MGEFAACDAYTIAGRPVGGEFIVAAAQILHERVPGRDGAQRTGRSPPAYRTEPGCKPTVIGVRGWLEHGPRPARPHSPAAPAQPRSKSPAPTRPDTACPEAATA